LPEMKLKEYANVRGTTGKNVDWGTVVQGLMCQMIE
jgi:hypothetical protein